MLFARAGQNVHLLALQSGVYRLVAEAVSGWSPSLPPLPAQQWRPSAQEIAAVEPESVRGEPWEVWRWLIALSLLATWAEWWLFHYLRGTPQTVGESLPRDSWRESGAATRWHGQGAEGGTR